MSILDKKGINVTSGFKLISGQPIDARQVVEDETELQSIIDNGAAYEGLEVWVKSVSKKYRYVGSSFVEVAEGGSGGESTNAQAIVDVDELPKPQWKDSTVPNTGYVEKVYLNTSLSNEEVINLISQLTYSDDNDVMVVLLATSDTIIVVQGAVAIADYYKVMSGDMSGIYWVDPSESDFVSQAGFEGWNPNFNGIIEINSEVVSEMEGVLVGDQNSLISHLFSNEQGADVNEQVIYRLKEIDVEGQVTYNLWQYKDGEWNSMIDKKEVVTFDMKFEVSDDGTVTIDDATIFNLEHLFDKIEKNNYKNLRLEFRAGNSDFSIYYLLPFAFRIQNIGNIRSRGIMANWIEDIYSSGVLDNNAFHIYITTADALLHEANVVTTNANTKSYIQGSTFTFYLS